MARKQWGYKLVPKAYSDSLSSWQQDMAFGTLDALIRDAESFDTLYNRLEDQESRDVFDWCIRSRMALALVGDVALSVFPSPLSREQHAAGVAAMREEYGQFQFSKFDLGSLGCGQYDLGPFCSVVENDVVLDIGGCYGDTMCKFWRQAGVGGEIHVFEPVEENRRSILSVLQEMGGPGNVFVVPYGAWDCSAIADIFVDSGCSSLTGGCFERECPEFEKVKLKTIDDYVAENGLRSVDFIKMDIEGAEEKALLGASETIARYRPKLAISVYHRFDDLTRIPAVILEAFPGYRFNMRHYHRGFFETVLYAVAGR